MVTGGGWVGQPITDPISRPSFDFTFTFGPELDKRRKRDLANKSFLSKLVF